ncbi:thrombospondin type 3 repeat-containing protein [Chryseobacterium polytrichastri]|uniref:Thrombospondin type 3 repeat-containing protein n=1 Tax=Chryseobacterium polytrichastri TaxID=1302687 RepID=A0A1M7C515_9FLAO|nr:Thrombospondin type 3 repeat-containing protein [Chryseobacterium polytrichastri]
MKKYIILFLFPFIQLYSQERINKEEFKKCKKEFSKQICLSDTDRDSILFYLDRCPKEKGDIGNFGCPWPDTDRDGVIDSEDTCPQIKGEIENYGCPWPDTDNDGILDKDDKCATVPGVPEENGCPKRGDCKEYFENEKIELANFKKKNSKEKAKFITLRKIIFNNIPKDLLIDDNIFVSIYANTFINDNISFRCSSRSTLSHDTSLFLDQLFWTKETFEYVSKKLNKNLIPTVGSRSTHMVDRNFIQGLKYGDSYYTFIQDFPELITPDNTPVFYYPRSKQKPKFNPSIAKLIVNFGWYSSNDEVKVHFYKSSNHYIYTYGYAKSQWKLINSEKVNY